MSGNCRRRERPIGCLRYRITPRGIVAAIRQCDYVKFKSLFQSAGRGSIRLLFGINWNILHNAFENKGGPVQLLEFFRKRADSEGNPYRRGCHEVEGQPCQEARAEKFSVRPLRRLPGLCRGVEMGILELFEVPESIQENPDGCGAKCSGRAHPVRIAVRHVERDVVTVLRRRSAFCYGKDMAIF